MLDINWSMFRVMLVDHSRANPAKLIIECNVAYCSI
jgi:hypothetical protein